MSLAGPGLALTLEDVSVRHPQASSGQAAALQSLDLRIAPGEQLAVIGPSGAGKTTLLQLLGCALRPATGRLLLDGQATGEPGLSPVFPLNNIDRGSHNLSVEILDAGGRTVERTANQPFHMWTADFGIARVLGTSEQRLLDLAERVNAELQVMSCA